jgi:hypothetical protein
VPQSSGLKSSRLKQYIPAKYKAFNSATSQSTTNNHLSLYDVPPTCFGLSMAILREGYNKGVQYWQILLKMCIYGVKNTKFSIKIAKNISNTDYYKYPYYFSSICNVSVF